MNNTNPITDKPINPNPQLWIILPVYQDSESFAWVRTKTLEVLAKDQLTKNLPVKFVAIDDTGGLDDKLAQLHDGTTTEVISCPFNMGHQRAIVFGIRSLVSRMMSNDIVVTMDSDGQDRPEDVLLLVKSVLENKASINQIVLARRTNRRESIRFRILYMFFKILFRLFTGTLVRTGNFACFSAHLIKMGIIHPYFDLCYSSTLLNLGFPVQYIDCPRADRHQGHSHMSLTRLLNHGIRMMMPFLDKISVRLIIFISGLIAIGAIVFGVGLYFYLRIGWVFPLWMIVLFFLLLTLSVVALLNFLILFALFSFSPLFPFSRQETRGPS